MAAAGRRHGAVVLSGRVRGAGALVAWVVGIVDGREAGDGVLGEAREKVVGAASCSGVVKLKNSGEHTQNIGRRSGCALLG